VILNLKQLNNIRSTLKNNYNQKKSYLSEMNNSSQDLHLHVTQSIINKESRQPASQPLHSRPAGSSNNSSARAAAAATAFLLGKQ
jgi:hypothetical protein